jgi:hypothetical protein
VQEPVSFNAETGDRRSCQQPLQHEPLARALISFATAETAISYILLPFSTVANVAAGKLQHLRRSAPDFSRRTRHLVPGVVDKSRRSKASYKLIKSFWMAVG